MNNYFSKRYGYQKNNLKDIKDVDDRLKNKTWNLIEKVLESLRKLKNNDRAVEILWDKFFGKRISELQYSSYNYINDIVYYRYRYDQIEEEFLKLEWNRFYDLLEFLMNNDPFSILKDQIKNQLTEIFCDEGIPVKIVNYKIVPITNEEELEEIGKILSLNDKYLSVKRHIQRAIEHFSKRPQPDYKNSIKESISAIEALARIFADNQSGTLGDLIGKLNIHPAFKDGLKKIYGWTSDEGGVRHAEKQYPPLSADEEEARLMLVLASAFVNYIISKYEQSNQ